MCLKLVLKTEIEHVLGSKDGMKTKEVRLWLIKREIKQRSSNGGEDKVKKKGM